MGEIVRKNGASGTLALFCVASLFSAIAIYITSFSVASTVFALFCLCLGVVLAEVLCKDGMRKDCIRIFVYVYISYITVAIFQYLSISHSIIAFSNTDNDHYMFWLESQVGANSQSISQIFQRCISDNEYFENGGYYFYLQSLAFYAQLLFDGNHLMLQVLGTTLPGMLSSIVCFKLLFYYVDVESAKHYALIYLLLSPALIVCLGIHRDAWIAFLYMCLVYLWYVKGFSLKTLLVELLICGLLLTIRIQHGMFAFVFIFLTALSSTKRYKWVFYLITLAIIITYGTLLFTLVNDEIGSTVAYYENRVEESLSQIDSGLGRYVYALPTPIKEFAQILVLQMQFPPWQSLLASTSFYEAVIGILKLCINALWLYIFLFSLLLFFKKKNYRRVPQELKLGFALFFLFILLNSTNLVLRRVVCIYPCLFILYAYLKSTVVTGRMKTRFSKGFIIVYSLLCLSYLGLKILF